MSPGTWIEVEVITNLSDPLMHLAPGMWIGDWLTVSWRNGRPMVRRWRKVR